MEYKTDCKNLKIQSELLLNDSLDEKQSLSC